MGIAFKYELGNGGQGGHTELIDRGLSATLWVQFRSSALLRC